MCVCVGGGGGGGGVGWGGGGGELNVTNRVLEHLGKMNVFILYSIYRYWNYNAFIISQMNQNKVDDS